MLSADVCLVSISDIFGFKRFHFNENVLESLSSFRMLKYCLLTLTSALGDGLVISDRPLSPHGRSAHGYAEYVMPHNLCEMII